MILNDNSHHFFFHLQFFKWKKLTHSILKSTTEVLPRLLISFSLTWGRVSMKSWAFAILHAAIISSSETSSFPKRMFSAIVVANKTGSWLTIPICVLSHFRFRDLILLLSKQTYTSCQWRTDDASNGFINDHVKFHSL